MTKNKRFELAWEDYDGWAILDTTGEYSDDEDYINWLSGQKAVDVLNHLSEENEQLKQFKEKVFVLFDKEITQNEKAIEWGEKQGAGVGAIGFHTNMLKILRKELQK